MSRQNEGTEELEKKDRKRKGEKQKASDNGVIKGETNEQAGRNFSKKKGTPAAETIFQSSSPASFLFFFFFPPARVIRISRRTADRFRFGISRPPMKEEERGQRLGQVGWA